MKEKIGKNDTRNSSLTYKITDDCLAQSKSGEVKVYPNYLVSNHFRSQARDSFQNFKVLVHLTSVLMNLCALPNL